MCLDVRSASRTSGGKPAAPATTASTVARIAAYVRIARGDSIRERRTSCRVSQLRYSPRSMIARSPGRTTMVIVTTAALVGCIASRPTSWTRESVAGLAITRKDPPGVEVYAFHSSGAVAAVVGPKDGPVTTPIMRWTVVDGRLRIDDDAYHEELTLVSRTADTIVVRRRTGELVTFGIRRQ